jgi:hypothetical protein
MITTKNNGQKINRTALPTARIELTTLSLLVTRSTTEPCGLSRMGVSLLAHDPPLRDPGSCSRWGEEFP